MSRAREQTIIASSAAEARLERCEAAEFVKASVDFTSRQGSKTLDAKLFATETTHNGPIDYRPMKIVNINVAVTKIESALGKITYETTRKAIARAGRIVYVFQ
jgi:hypothetical protein